MMDLGLSLDEARRENQAREFRRASAVKPIKEKEVGRWGLNNPHKYHEMYGFGKEMSGTDLTGAFMNGESTHGNALLTRSSLEIFPGMYSHDVEVLHFLRELSNEANRLFPVDLDGEGFTKTGIHSSFDSLRCPAGYFQTPMSYTTVDNALYRQELGLPSGYSDRQRKIAEEVWHLVFRNVKPCPVNVAKLSTGGMRRFSSSVQWKLDYANFVTQPAEFEVMLDAVDKGDWLTLANRFEMIFATYIQKRGQVDVAGKKRMVFDAEYARTGGRSGRMFETDKKVFLHGMEWPDFSAIRARVVHAGPWVINCFLQMIASPTMQAMFTNFPETFHVNTREQIKKVVDGNYIFCSDVTEYDRSMSRDAISVVHDVMKEYWDERMVKASWRLFTSPYYAKPLGLESGRGQWMLNPLKGEDEVFAGNRSGHALTSLVAKVNKVIESLFIIDHIYPVLGRCERFLKHQMPIKLINNGDDEVVVCSSKSDMDRFKVLRADLSLGHYVVSPEAGNGFSGLLISKPTDDLIYEPIPKVHTSLQKTFIPERSIGGHHREYWPIGAMVRVDNLNESSIGREVWSLTLSMYRKHLEPKHGDIRAIIAKAASSMSIHVDSLSDQDKEVLDDPDKLHYKWLPEEINDDVVSRVSSKVPLERVSTIVNRYCTAHQI